MNRRTPREIESIRHEALRDIRGGMSAYSLAKNYGVTLSTASRWRRMERDDRNSDAQIICACPSCLDGWREVAALLRSRECRVTPLASIPVLGVVS